MKKAFTIIGIVVLVAVMSIPVAAQGPGPAKARMVQASGPNDPGNCAPWGWSDRLTDEQRTQLDKLRQKFFDETASLRSQMAAKHSELNILMNTSKPDFEKAKTLQKELSDLRAKMDQEKITRFAEERKINPDARFGKRWSRKGMDGRSPYGNRMSMGYARGVKRGAGTGPCWN